MRIRFNANLGNIMEEQMLMKKIEMIQLKNKIEVFSTFVSDELLTYKHSGIAQFVAVVLWMDISGCAFLAEKYNKTGTGGIYHLTATLNAYLGSIIEIIFSYGGDVLTITEQVVVTIWRVSSDVSLFEMIDDVVMCAIIINKTLNNFRTELNTTLSIRNAISCGNVTFCTLGESDTKKCITYGAAFHEVIIANQRSDRDVIVCPSAWSHMKQENYQAYIGTKRNVRISNIFYKAADAQKKSAFEAKQMEAIKLVDIHMQNRKGFQFNNKYNSSAPNSRLSDSFIRQLPVRRAIELAPRSWALDEMQPYILKQVQDHVHESQPIEYLTEIRNITLQSILIDTDVDDDEELMKILQGTLHLICTVSAESLGIVKKMATVKTQTEIMVMYGLRGLMHEMESQNALRSSFEIKRELLKIPGIVGVSIGITSGKVYCGVLGHPMRRDYLIIGYVDSKARKIMFAFRNRITCDYGTFKFSRLASFYFKRLLMDGVKGYEESIVFEYDENKDYGFLYHKNIPMSLIGRSVLVKYIDNVLTDAHKPYRGICLIGLEKSGKSAILQNAMQLIEHDCLTASIELEVNMKIPYFCISKLYQQLYNKLGAFDESGWEFVNLPRDMLDPTIDPESYFEDIGLQKYRILNYFRNILSVSKVYPTIIFIDNLDFIDLQSWEILEIVLDDCNVRYLFTGTFNEASWDLRFKLSLNEYMKTMEIVPLERKYIASVVCQFLKVDGIPQKLLDLLVLCCDGRPGYIQSCLLRLMNNGSIEFKLISRIGEDLTDITYPNPVTGNLVSVVKFFEKFRSDNISLAAISLDVFDSFPTYCKLVIKTASVLGNLFTRMLLVVALKYPTELTLAKVIQQLFEEEIFDCGSRFVSGGDIDLITKVCCQCYFDEGFFLVEERRNMPRYAYCKIIHFKNKNIRDVTYKLLPGNQRKELHLICTDILENINHYCPNCMRDPSNIFLCWLKYKEIISYCENPNTPIPEIVAENFDNSAFRECVKQCIVSKKVKAMNARLKFSNPDPIKCYCFEVMLRTYTYLIYHSENAGHTGKRIFFTLQYGQILICLRDLKTAIKVLTEARELCLMDSNSNAEITEPFRKLMLGKICIALAQAALYLRQLMTAKNHLVIALRQYNIPSLALSYKHFNKLLTRSFLVNSKKIIARNCKNMMVRCDLGMCLAHCARLLTLEGHWNLAKMICSYSVYILRSISTNIPLLFDAYCTAIDIYRHVSELKICEKLQRSFLRDFQLHYSCNNTFNIFALSILLNSVFEVRAVLGDINGAIRLGYRIIDINSKLHMEPINCRGVMMLSYLLYTTFRLKESVDVLRLLLLRPSCISIHKRELTYYTACLSLYLYTGFYAIPIEDITKFAYGTLKFRQVKHNWEHYYFFGMLQVYYARMGDFQRYNDWNYRLSFFTTTAKRESVLWALMACLECKTIMLLKYREMKNPNVVLEEKLILNLLKLFKEVTKTHCKLYLPNYMCYKAWWNRINGRKRKANAILDRIIPICDKQNNVLQRCYAMKLKSYWNGGHSIGYRSREVANYEEAITYSEMQWAQCLHPLPYS